MNYTTIENVKKYLNVTVEDAYTAQIDSWITAMSQYVDKYCNRVITRDTPETRTFIGYGSNSVVIDECTAIESVTLDGNALDASAYTTLPRNRDYVQALQLPRVIGSTGELVIEAVFAHTVEVPSDVEFAVTVLVAGIVNTTRAGGDNVSSEKVGQYSITYRNANERADIMQAKAILDGYKRLAF